MYAKKHIKIKGKEMAYIDEGQGDPIVFLHGNPTSSYLWRNIAPHVEGLGRIVIPDLIGMGDSEKLKNVDDPGYKYHGQYDYLTSLLEEINLGNNIHLVIHDWGSAMGFQFARENSERIKSITFMEAIVMPMVWDQWPEMARKIFGLYRSEAGEELILEKNYFVEKILFLDAPSLSEEGEPPEVVDEVQKNADFHKDSDIPKLFINADPGSILIGDQREFVRSWKNLTEVTVKGNHFIQETSPDQIGKNLANFLESIG